MSKLSFLQKVVVKQDVKVSTRTHETKKPAEGSDLRVYYNGEVYPSEKFAQRFNLEFQPKEKVPTGNEDGGFELEYGENPGNGLDVFSSANFGGIENAEQTFIMLTAVPRTEGKLDLFKSCEYDEEGQPKTSVLVQGSTTFGKAVLLPMLKEVYGIELDKTTMPCVDLTVVGHGDKFDMPWRNANGSEVYRIPKTLARGEEKGKVTTVRRENIYLWAMVPSEWLQEAGPIVLSGPAYVSKSAPQSDAVGNGPGNNALVQADLFTGEQQA